MKLVQNTVHLKTKRKLKVKLCLKVGFSQRLTLFFIRGWQLK